MVLASPSASQTCALAWDFKACKYGNTLKQYDDDGMDLKIPNVIPKI